MPFVVTSAGYSTYAPTKFAIRGLGECLRSELLPHNITVCQAYPPGFESPGFANENLTKPADTKVRLESILFKLHLNR